MKLLLDTHAFIWWDENPGKLGLKAREACLNTSNDLVLSAASVWEMQLKAMTGKLALRKPLRELISDQIRQNGVEILPVQLEHAYRVESLPFHHRDPFDRLLIAQAQVEGWTLVSHDAAISKYDIPVLW